MMSQQAAAHVDPDAHGSQRSGVGGEAAADAPDVRLPAPERHNHLRVLAHAGGVLCAAEPPERPAYARQTGSAPT